MNTLNRRRVQSRATKAIIDNYYQGIYNIAPRVGKSKIVIDALKKIPKERNVLITVPFNPIIDDGRGNGWLNEFPKWKLPKNRTPKVINQRSLEKEPDDHYDLVIADEIHSLSERQRGEIQRVSKKDTHGNIRLMGITGSLGKNSKKVLWQDLKIKEAFVYTIDEAIADEIIAGYQIYVVSLPLSVKKDVEVVTKKKTYMTSEEARYASLTKIYEQFRYQAFRNPRMRNAQMGQAGKRARFIYGAPSKIELAKTLLHQHKRALVFGALTATVDEIAGIGYHTKSSGDELMQFFNEEINHLGVVDMTSMGVTFPNLKVGIFHQMKSSEEMAIQKVLRMCNLEHGSGDAQIYICMYSGTVDEKWVMNAISPFNKERVHFEHANYLKEKQLIS